MEKLSELSNVVLPHEVQVNIVPDTLVGFRDKYRAKIQPATSVDENKDTITFNIMPCVAGELDLRDSYLDVTMRAKKGNDALPAGDQISICQTPALLAWESIRVFVAGEEIIPGETWSNHVKFIAMMTKLDKKEREIQLRQSGFRDGKLVGLLVGNAFYCNSNGL